MTQLQAFLYAIDESGAWVTSTFTDLEPLMAATRVAMQGEDPIALVHVGFWEPTVPEVAALAEHCAGSLIVSDPAAGALCEHLTADAAAVGCIRGVVFRLVLNGLGSRGVARDHVPVTAAAAPPALPAAPPLGTEFARPLRGDWFAELASRDPELANRAGDAGIVDEESYNVLEAALPRSLRLDLGLARWTVASGEQPVADTVLEHLWASPPWFMNLRLTSLGLTVRQANVFRTHDLRTVADISAKGFAGLMMLPNLGHGSIHGLRKLLVDALEGGAGLPADQGGRAPGLPAGSGGPPGVDNLSAGFKAVAGLLTDAERNIWASRIGLECPQVTLQQLGDGLGLTRERVRQLETQVYRKVQHHPFWPELASRLDSALRARTTVLPITELPAVDDWFAEAPSLATPLVSTLRALMGDRFGALEIHGEVVLSHLRPQEWNEVRHSARALLESGAPERIEEGVARWQCDQLLTGRGEELRASLWAEITAGAQWSMRPGQPRRLVSLSRGVEGVVLAVLESSEEPLHFTEIHRRAATQYSSAHDLRSVQHAAQAVGILFGRGSYGLPRNCPLSEEEMSLVRAEVEDVVSGGEPTRQWHASELCDVLLERGLGFDGRLTKYVLNHALKDCSALVYLRRMVWGLSGAWQAGAASRLDVRQAVIGLLEAHGGPMSTAEVRARLASVRGVNQTFQIFPSDPLLRIGPGLWGLLHRDVDVSGAQILLDRLREALQLRQTGLHLSELPEVPGLGLTGGPTPESAWMAVAETAGIRVDRGQYAYLSEWGASRRLAVPDAVKAAVADVGAEGVVFEDICRRVNAMTQREVPAGHVSQALRGMDLNYDPARRLWMPEPQDAGS